MNTPRQPNVHTRIEQIPSQIRNSGHYSHLPTSFNTDFMPGSKPASGDAPPPVTAKDRTPGPVATVRKTGTLRLPLAVAHAMRQRR
jgi:hypothetical protein